LEEKVLGRGKEGGRKRGVKVNREAQSSTFFWQIGVGGRIRRTITRVV